MIHAKAIATDQNEIPSQVYRLPHSFSNLPLFWCTLYS